MQRTLFLMALCSLLLVAKPVLAFDPNFLISDAELQDEDAMNLEQIQAFLTRGTLADLRIEDHEGRMRSAAEIIWRAAQNNNINPKFLLVLLQKEQSLVEDLSVTQKQLDWATGYAVCDYCSMNDPSIGRWKGFGKQVNSAAMQFSDGYMRDIEETGVTAGRYGTNMPVMIDGKRVVPANAATAALYAYTPHLHGNQVFMTIWNRWFGREYPSGSLLQAAGEDGVWLIERGYRRPITSASALHSRFDANLIVQVNASVIEAFPIGKPISFPNYSLLRDEDGHIYLLVDDTLRHITSMEAFRKIGFSEDELVDISSADAENYTQGEAITVDSSAPQGRLLKLKTGTMFYVAEGKRHLIIDPAVAAARFPGQKPEVVEPVVVEQFVEGKPLNLPDGQLVRSPEEPAVYVISEGERRLIPTESVFLSYGYDWADVRVVAASVLRLHPIGDDLTEGLTEE